MLAGERVARLGRKDREVAGDRNLPALLHLLEDAGRKRPDGLGAREDAVHDRFGREPVEGRALEKRRAREAHELQVREERAPGGEGLGVEGPDRDVRTAQGCKAREGARAPREEHARLRVLGAPGLIRAEARERLVGGARLREREGVRVGEDEVELPALRAKLERAVVEPEELDVRVAQDVPELLDRVAQPPRLRRERERGLQADPHPARELGRDRNGHEVALGKNGLPHALGRLHRTQHRRDRRGDVARGRARRDAHADEGARRGRSLRGRQDRREGEERGGEDPPGPADEEADARAEEAEGA